MIMFWGIYLAVYCSFITGSRASCPQGWMEIAGKCYKSLNGPGRLKEEVDRERSTVFAFTENADKKNWEDARDYCRTLSADLPSFTYAHTDVHLQTFIITTLVGQLVWIGLSDRQTEGDYRWSDGTTFGYANWDSGEPNGLSAENCVYYIPGSYKWNDAPCDLSLAFICTTGTSQPTTTTSTTTTSTPPFTGCSWELECKAKGRKKRSVTESGFRKVNRNNGIYLVKD